MATKREKLENRAKELGLEFVPSTTDDELQELINDFEEQPSGEDVRYFKSSIAGLQIQIGDEPDRDEQPTLVRFTPYEFRDEKRGDNYHIGFLATEEPDAIEIMADDPNVEEISKEDYDNALQEGKRAKY